MIANIRKVSMKRFQSNLNLTKKRKMFWCYIFIFPQLVMLVLFTLYPIFMSYYYSFFDWSGYGSMKFVGFKNYTETIFEPLFWNAFKNSLECSALNRHIECCFFSVFRSIS